LLHEVAASEVRIAEQDCGYATLTYCDICHGKMVPQSKGMVNMRRAGHAVRPHIHTCGHMCDGAFEMFRQ
jgi:hypothetical protein